MSNVTLHPFLADPWNVLKPGDLLTFFAEIGVLVAIAVGVLTIIHLSRVVFGRKPPIADDLRSQKEVLDGLKLSLAGLAPNEKVEELVQRLGAFATQAQLREIELQLPELIKRDELERCLEKIERQQEARLKEFSAYMHDEVHKMRGDIGVVRLEGNEAREGLHRRIESLIKVSFENRGTLNAIQEALRAS